MEQARMTKCTTANEAVWRNGGGSPQKVQCEFGSLPPAGSSVEAATTPSRWDVSRNLGTVHWKIEKLKSNIMRKLIVIILMLNTTGLFAQKFCHTDILNGEKLKSKNVVEQYLKYDFSDLWIQEKHTLGIIGDDYQRLYIKLIHVVKNESAPNEYLVYGRSKVRNNLCDFVGKITIEKIQETDREWFGVDNVYEGKSKTQGVLIAHYEFFESKTQKHTGIFSGILMTKWYLDKTDKMKYDDMNIHSDAYFNNSFVGTWTMYNSNLKKTCNWADYRVPNVKCDFDIGAGEFSVNEKYIINGWNREEEQQWWK
jgi:hypothetical protein